MGHQRERLVETKITRRSGPGPTRCEIMIKHKLICMIMLSTMVTTLTSAFLNNGIDLVTTTAKIKCSRNVSPSFDNNKLPTTRIPRSAVFLQAQQNKSSNNSGDDRNKKNTKKKKASKQKGNKKSTSTGTSKKKSKSSLSSKSSSQRQRKQQQLKLKDNSKKKEAVAKAAAEYRKRRQQQQEQESTLAYSSNAPSSQKKKKKSPGGGILETILDPFQAGKQLRKTIDTALTTLGTSTTTSLPSERRSIYYLDDRFSDTVDSSQSSSPLFAERNPLFDRLVGDDFVPEVLVVGATGEVGRRVVRRLLLDGRFRVRVLVRDLYSTTLNLLGTSVTYCQGDLSNMQSLEYAVTDVDKIVFCAGAPRLDESDFQGKFQDFIDETLEEQIPSPTSTTTGGDGVSSSNGTVDIRQQNQSHQQKSEESEKQQSDEEWLQLESVLQLRSKLAEQVDYIGMQNLIQAYQNVRYADFGTSQAAKRSLFKFQKRPEDFNLFAIDDDDDLATTLVEEPKNNEKGASSKSTNSNTQRSYSHNERDEADEYDDFMYNDEDAYSYENDDSYGEYDKEHLEDNYGDEESYTTASRRSGATAIKAQCNWFKNKFEHGVFAGKVPIASPGWVSGGVEAAVVSSRLRSREDPEKGIDLSNGFAGFVCRTCADGGNYEAFVRTGLYETDGVEYVCEFRTSTKPTSRGNKSKNKFITLRLAFESFHPVQRKNRKINSDETIVPPFRGGDIRQFGFRYRAESNKDRESSQTNPASSDTENKNKWSSFYLALCYVKVYRAQPEPEFVYLSDSRIPPVVHNSMVKHHSKRLGEVSDDDNTYAILDEVKLRKVSTDRMDRSGEETYYKYRGEEILKNSGLCYCIVRVSAYNESPTGDSSSIDLLSSNADIAPVSRADVAQVCVSALLDPSALNKSFYMSKSKQRARGMASEEDMSGKFKRLPPDVP